MAEKNDDIKNLFLNLGLNPSDYHEIRSAPTANATVSEAPRRWSLLQAAAAPKSLIKPATPLPTLTPAVTAAPIEAPQPPAATLSAALLAAARDIARAEANTSAPVASPAAVSVPATAPAALPSILAEAFAQPTSSDGLQSLFQSVKEPQTVSVAPQPDGVNGVGERRTDQLYSKSPMATSPSMRAAALPEQAPARLLVADDEPETRHAAPMLSRLGPVPPPPPPPIVSAPPAPASSGQLRFATPAAEAGSGHGESLQDVFRRLSRDNRG